MHEHFPEICNENNTALEDIHTEQKTKYITNNITKNTNPKFKSNC